MSVELIGTDPRAAGANVAHVRQDFLCRVSGLPATAFRALRAERTMALLKALWDAEQVLIQCKDPAVDALHGAVGGEPDRDRRRRLLRLKRNAFNLRPLEAADLDGLELTAPSLAQVGAYLKAFQRRDHLWKQIPLEFGGETQRIRSAFRTLLANEDFQAGLLISSRSLYSALPSYLASDEAAPTARDEHVERGLMRYLSRMAMKATPFGTFCAVVAGRFGAENGTAATFTGDPRAKRSYVRLNKALYGFLIGHLRQRPAVRRRLSVELNPTLEEEGDRQLFLTAVANREAFQRVERNAVLDLIADRLQDGPAPLGELIAALVADERLETDEAEITTYLDRLLALGFLRFRTGIREQDPDWDLRLKPLLEGIDDPHAAACAALLGDLRAAADRYSVAGVGERSRLLDQTRRRIEETLAAMAITVTTGRRLPIYEDATADARLDLALDPARSAAFRDLTDYTTRTLCAAWPRGEQATMRHFFDSFYGPERLGVPLLRFYEDYYREHFKRHLERQRRGVRPPGEADEDGEKAAYNLSNPFQLSLITGIQNAQMKVRQLVEQRCHEAPLADAVTIRPDELSEAMDLPPRPAPCRSLSMFAQLVPTDDGDAFLITPSGWYLAGYGKYFSRFLYMLPDELSRRTYDDSLRLTDARLAEICGDASFNANLHPPLLRWEISYPTGETGDQQSRISSAALDVGRDPADSNALRLVHRPSGTPVFPVDLGFLNPRLRPPLYQLIAQFGPPVVYGLPLPPLRAPSPSGAAPPATDTARRQDTPSPGAGTPSAPRPQEPDRTVRYRPRIMFGDRLVLTRRCWSVPGEVFPRWAPGGALVDYFVAVNRWRQEHRIPEQVYVRIHRRQGPPEPSAPEGRPPASPPAPQAPDQETARGPQTVPSRDFAKPQFIDFANPLLVGLFGRMPGFLERFDVAFEERFPAEPALMYAGEDGFATELILQIDYREAPSDALTEAWGDRDGV